MSINTPILFLIFNRPVTTQRVFAEIRKAMPKKLFISSDGPRENKQGEHEKCQAVRDIIKQVDWDCQVFTNFRDKNLGCKAAVSSGIEWFFENVEEGIILEDDTLPHPTFFRFCEELLERYRDDERISIISGDNFQFGRRRTSYSYYFSRYHHIWGWASWRRFWKHYDVDMKLWTEIRDGGWLNDLLGGNKESVDFWMRAFEDVYQGRVDTWDYQLVFAAWVQGCLSIISNTNLVSNIGYGSDATRTTGESKFANMKTEPATFPILHSPYIIRDSVADGITEKDQFTSKPLPVLARAYKRLKGFK
ncbi:MAG: glycosyltransferase family 2 protein [Nitrospinae bacterium]|nr:glycosyltransferase family 2 protein [Nitrospinota bacterium]